MITFDAPIVLTLAPVVAVAVWAAAAWARRSRVRRAAAWSEITARIARSAGKRGVPALGLAAGLAAVALAGPRWGEEQIVTETRGLNVVFAIDISRSMLAEDAKPSRLGRALREARRLVQDLDGDRLGLSAFAGTSYILSHPVSRCARSGRRVRRRHVPRAGPGAGNRLAARQPRDRRSRARDLHRWRRPRFSGAGGAGSPSPRGAGHSPDSRRRGRAPADQDSGARRSRHAGGVAAGRIGESHSHQPARRCARGARRRRAGDDCRGGAAGPGGSRARSRGIVQAGDCNREPHPTRPAPCLDSVAARGARAGRADVHAPHGGAHRPAGVSAPARRRRPDAATSFRR